MIAIPVKLHPSASLLAAVLLLASCGRPDTGEQSGTGSATGSSGDVAAGSPLPRATPLEAPTGEVLLARAPDGWKETAVMQTPVLRMAEYGPAEEPPTRTERLTFEAEATQPLPDPIEFVLSVSRALAARCDGFEDINISSGHENGYPTSVRLMICPKFKDSPHGQVVMAKAIRGNEKFYVITRRLQVPPMEGDEQPLTAQAMAAWTTHLKGVQVCDTREDQHACPESVAGTPDPEATAPAETPEQNATTGP